MVVVAAADERRKITPALCPDSYHQLAESSQSREEEEAAFLAIYSVKNSSFDRFKEQNIP
jgi:hypothetical protein